jgi:hypothetical protein
MILIGLVVFALTQLYYMHRGLKLCSTSVLYPLVFCVYNIIAIIDGLIYFHQSDRLSGLHAGLIALGTAILLAGVVCLSWRLEDADDEPTSPVAHKHMGKVPMPESVLQPGIGLVHGHILDEPEEPLDIEAEAPGLHGSLSDQAKRRSVDERTPLLQRAGTGPGALTLSARPKKRPVLESQSSGERASPSLRKPPRRRRMTISEETDEIWAELNDRDSLPSPARRSADLERRPRSGTLPGRRKASQSSWLNQMRRRSWFDSLGSQRSRSVSQGKRPVDSSTGLLDHPDPQDDDHSDTDNVLSSDQQRRGTWGYGQRGDQSQDALGDWFKLKWWRKRWREGDEGDEHEDR